MNFTEIWNEAYNLYTNSTRSEMKCYNDMQDFLEEQVKLRNLSADDKNCMVQDIVETASL